MLHGTERAVEGEPMPLMQVIGSPLQGLHWLDRCSPEGGISFAYGGTTTYHHTSRHSVKAPANPPGAMTWEGLFSQKLSPAQHVEANNVWSHG